MNKLLLISIKDKYVKEILSGHKKIELRKSMPKANVGDTVIIYTTQPQKCITAIAKVNKILKTSPNLMWIQYKDLLGVTKSEFDNYYLGKEFAIGLEIVDVVPLETEILLSSIKAINPKFTPPQTFKYLDKYRTFRDYAILIKRVKNII